MKEIWKDIVNYEGLYQISNLGSIKSLDRYVKYPNYMKHVRGVVISQKAKPNGYIFVNLYKDGKEKSFYVHRLVALHFVDGFFDKADVNHIDGNKTNNFYKNLEWCTRSHNIKHSFRVLGRSSPKPTPSNKVKVVQLEENGTFVKEWESICEAARTFGVDESNIRRCIYDKEHHQMTHGYKWIRASEYYAEDNKEVFCGKVDRRFIGKPVHQYTLDGLYLKTFCSTREAARHVCGNNALIMRVARKGKGCAYGYKWVYQTL